MATHHSGGIYQGMWNVMTRDLEREVIPMARSEDMAIARWNALTADRNLSDVQEHTQHETGEKGYVNWAVRTYGRVVAMGPALRWERDVVRVHEEVSAEVSAKSIQAIGIAYGMQKVPYAFPTVGGPRVEHLHSKTLDIAFIEAYRETCAVRSRRAA